MKKFLSSLISKTFVLLLILTITLSGCGESLFVPIIEEFDEANPPLLPGVTADFSISPDNDLATVSGSDIYTNTNSFVISSSKDLDGVVYYKFWTGGSEPDEIVSKVFNNKSEVTISLADVINSSGTSYAYSMKIWYSTYDDETYATDISGTIHYDTQSPTVSLSSTSGDTVSTSNLALEVTGSSDSNRIKLWNELQSEPSSYSEFTTSSQTNSLPPSASEGSSYTVSAVLMDRAGNISSPDSISVTYDPGLPSVSGFKIAGGDSATNNNKVSMTYTASDSGTDVKVQFSNDGTNWSTAEEATGSHADWDIINGFGALSGDGTKTVYIRAVDEAENYSPVASASIIFDSEAPQLSELSIVQEGGNTDYTVALNYTVTDLTSIDVEFSNDNTTWTSPASVSNGDHTYNNWDIIDSTSGGTAGSGDKTVYIRVTDEAGNSDDTALGTVTYNASGLIISGFYADEGEAADSTSITVNYEMNDPGEDVTIKLANELPGNWSAVAIADTLTSVLVGNELSGSTSWSLPAGDGPKTVYIYAQTATLSDSDSFVIEFDSTSPEITSFSLTETGPTNDNTVTLNYTLANMAGTALTMEFSNNNSDWSDPVDVSSISGSIGNWDLTDTSTGGSTATGSKDIYMRVTDAVGHEDTVAIANPIYYDEKDPAIGSFAISGVSATNSSSVNLTFSSVSDDSGNTVTIEFSNNGSSWTTPSSALTSPYSWDLTTSAYGGTSGDGQKTVYIRATDEAGNSVIETDTVYYDTTVPQCALAVMDDNEYTSGGLITLEYEAYGTGTIAEVRFSNNSSDWSSWEPVSGSDDESQTMTKSWNVISGYGGNNSQVDSHTVYMQVKDQVGLTGEDEIAGIIYDATAPNTPTVTVIESDPAPFITGQGYISSRTLSVTVDHSEDSDYYKIWDNGMLEPSVFQSVPTGPSFNASYTIPEDREDGTYLIYVKLFDMAENSASDYETVRLDTTNPSLSFLTIAYDDVATSTVSDPNLNISYSASDSFGLAGYKLWDSSVSEPAEFTRISVTPVPDTYSLPDVSGEYTVYLTFCDGAGNVPDTSLQQSVIYDGDPPTINTMIVYDSSNDPIAYNLNGTIANGSTSDNNLLVSINVNSNTPASTYKVWYTGEIDQVKNSVSIIDITEDYYSLILTRAGDYVIHAVAYDLIGNESNELTATVTYAP